ncbi:MAG: GNAT family N-acetyltransferase [Massiliimalia sp.]|jgi:GNAT superfamily N-acetyltransferase
MITALDWQTSLPEMKQIFANGTDSIITSWLDGIMGTAFGDGEHPRCGQICLGDFCFFAGDAQAPGAAELVANPAPDCHGSYIAIGDSEAWNQLIEAQWGETARPISRYAMNQPAAFSRAKLERFTGSLPAFMELRQIDSKRYHQVQEQDWSRDFCSNFPTWKEFQENGLGFVILLDHQVIGGASSYSVCRNGLEIEIGVREDFRHQGLGTICGAKLILACLERGWTPYWDAANLYSVRLAEKLGYELKGEYRAYSIPKSGEEK